MPDLRLRERARRPVRQLRQPARSHRPDRSAFADRRDDTRLREDEAPLSRPARVQGAADGLDRVAGALAAERQEVLAQLREGTEAASDHARPRLGSADPARGLRGSERQADLRLVRRGDRVSLRIDRVGSEPRHARCLARVVAEPGGGARVLHGEGQHRLPHRDLAEQPARLRGRRGIRSRTRAARAARQHRLERVPDDGREEVQLEQRGRDPRARLLEPLRPRRVAVLPLDRGPGDAGHGLHVVGVRPPQQRRARRDLGQPREPHTPERVQELRRRARAECADRVRRAAARGDREGIRVGRGADRSCALQERPARDHAARRARQPVRHRASPVDAPGVGSRASGDGPLRRAEGDRQPEDPAHAVPALLVSATARATRLRQCDRRPALCSGR